MTLAHGLGGSTDLPIPFSYALIGAAWALTFSFAVLALAWRKPRLSAAAPGLPVPKQIGAVLDSPALRVTIGTVSVLFTGVVVALAMFGSSTASRNPLPGVLYVFVWVGVMLASVVLGPVWKVISPVRAIHRLLCRVLDRQVDAAVLRYRPAWGYWPGVAGLFAFVWMELASPDPGSVRTVGIWCACYLVVTLSGLLLFGTDWAENADPFEVYSSLVGHLSPLARLPDRSLTLRWPLNNLAGVPVRPGLVALVATLLGSTAYDSFAAFPQWADVLARTTSDVVETLLRTGGLLGFVAGVGLIFWLAARATGGLNRSERALLPGRLAHSIVPIVVGYIVAHYLTFLVEKGQATLVLFADPFDRGWNLAGLAGRDVDYILSTHPTLLVTLKVLSVLSGHILGVIAAHDRSLALLPPAYRLTGQLALLLTMVGFTFGGLYLLFGG
ncbi:hypothetical protein [Antrihabitans sp. YC2-6]|uniref:hypothetical protein n=1 Tax=Antrihabitans sp. YC2-6 TaxID=2799498 RepID=UPI0018F6FEFD|nr:hypothetical protein [Antrihabitans sp. YC2-6]MBJ8347665.1 hypothetical protein [Antrihabitans sp. YC2-6]